MFNLETISLNYFEPIKFTLILKISFILPCLIKIPIGGVKVIYRYSEELSKQGHEISIISPIREGNHVYHLLKSGAVKIRDYLQSVENKPYYNTPPGVDHYIISSPSQKYISYGDCVIATGWQTAYWVDSLPKVNGKKLILGYL